MTAFFLAFPVLLLAVGFVLYPYLRHERRADVARLAADLDFDPLLERKNTLLSNILELEFEHRMGKLSDADFLAARRHLEAETAELLDRIEAEASVPAPPASESAPKAGSAEPLRLCPACGASNPSANRFCGHCGGTLEKAS